jgi:hypothetical protein
MDQLIIHCGRVPATAHTYRDDVFVIETEHLLCNDQPHKGFYTNIPRITHVTLNHGIVTAVRLDCSTAQVRCYMLPVSLCFVLIQWIQPLVDIVV